MERVMLQFFVITYHFWGRALFYAFLMIKMTILEERKKDNLEDQEILFRRMKE